MSFTVSEAQRAITELYVGIFNRAPDPEGLAFWTGKLVDEGADIDVVRAEFVSSPEWQNGVGQQTNAQVIQHLYESLFEREPEQEGFEFWLNELETGVTTVDQIVAVLIANASAYDQLTLDNKTDAALYYTTEAGAAGGFNGEAAVQAVDSVDSTSESLEASKAATDRSLEDDGSVYTLTSAEDEIIVGSQYDDIIRGNLGSTLSGFDTVDGRQGDDTLELAVNYDGILGVPGFVDVRNVETVTFDIVQGGLDVEFVGGDNFEGLDNVNVYSTGGTAQDIIIEADVKNINVGVVRDESGSVRDASGNLVERGVLEDTVDIEIYDNTDAYDTNIAVSTDYNININSTGDLGVLDLQADGEGIDGDTNSNDIRVVASGTIASVTSVAGDDTNIESLEGNIVSVNATGSLEYSNSNISVTAAPDDQDAYEGSEDAGNIEDVTATAFTGYVDVLALNDIGTVEARADDGVDVVSQRGDIDSVVVTNFNDRYGDEQTANYVNIEAGYGASEPGAGSIGTVDVEASGYIDVYASDDITSVTADSAYNFVTVESQNGDIGSVTAEGGAGVTVSAADGTIGTVDATGGSIYIVASDDITDVDAVAVGWGKDIHVESFNGDIAMVNADASDDVIVISGGNVGSVEAEAGGLIEVTAQGDITSVDADGDQVNLVAAAGGSIGEAVRVDADNDVWVTASDDIGVITGSGSQLTVTAGGTVGEVTFAVGSDGSALPFDLGPAAATVPAGEDIDVRILGAEAVGDVSVTSTISDEGLGLVVASVGTVDSVSVDLGETQTGFTDEQTAYIDIHAQADTSVDVTLTADSDANIDLFVGSAISDTEGTPVTLNLTVDALDNADGTLDIDGLATSSFQSGSDESSVLETINVDGAANANFTLDELVGSLTTFNGGDATGDLGVYMHFQSDASQNISVTTGSGDDEVYLIGDAATSDSGHGTIEVSTGEGSDFVGVTSGTGVEGSVTINTGADDDFVAVGAGSDAEITVDAGGGDDLVVLLASDSGSTYVPVSYDVDVGDGDDIVAAAGTYEDMTASSFALGAGTNALHLDFADDGELEFSDSDTAGFSLDNTTGSVHTLNMDVDFEITSDVTLDLTHNGGEGRVSVLEVDDIDLDGDADDGVDGATFTVVGGAEDFTLSAGADGFRGIADDQAPDRYSGDLGETTGEDHRVDEDALRLSLDGVVNATLQGDEVGVILDAADNTALNSVTARSTNGDEVDLVLTGFTDFGDVLLESAANANDDADPDEVELYVFGGDYGTVTLEASDETTIVNVLGSDGQGDSGPGIDVTDDYQVTIDTLVMDSSSNSDGDTWADGQSQLIVDGSSGEDDWWSGAGEDRASAEISIGAVGGITMTGNYESNIQVSDFSDSTITLGDIDLNVLSEGEDAGEDSFGEDAGITVDDINDSTISIGMIDVDAYYSDEGGNNYSTAVDVLFTDMDNVALDIDEINVSATGFSDGVEGGYSSTSDIRFADIEDSVVTVGDITGVGEVGDVDVEFDYNDNTTISGGHVSITTTGNNHDASLFIYDNNATDDGADTAVNLLSVSLSATGANGADVDFEIESNDDDFTAGTVEISVNNVSLTADDDVDFFINDNDNLETDQFAPVLTPVVGVQIDVSDVTIVAGQASDVSEYWVELEANDNDGANIQIGDVTVTGGTSDTSYYAYNDIDDDITSNSWTNYERGDTDMTLRVGDNQTHYVYTDISGNDDTAIELGDYSVTLLGSDGAESFSAEVDFVVDYNFDGADEDGVNSVDIGDITIDASAASDSGYILMALEENYDGGSITLGDISLSGGANMDAYLWITDNDGVTVETGDVNINVGDNVIVTIEDHDASGTDSDITVGSVTATGGSVSLWITDNYDSVIVMSDVSLTALDGSVDIEIDSNDNSTVDLGNITADASDDVDIYVDTGDGVDGDGDIQMGDITVTAGDDAYIYLWGDNSDNDDYGALTVGDIDVTIDGDPSISHDVRIEALGLSSDSVGTITVSGVSDYVQIDIVDRDDTYDTSTATSLIDLSGMTNSDADIYIDLVDVYSGGVIDDSGTAGDAANLESDMVIRFGEFDEAFVGTLINDHEDQFNIADGDGVRQTYSFEGDDIGDIIIEGFVAGRGAYRDVDIDGDTTDGYGDAGVSDFFEYDHTSGAEYDDGLVLLRTDRLDFSQFEGVSSLEDLAFEYDDDTDSVIITAADGEFSGRIVVTGVGVDADNGDSIESIIDRVQDSIIFG